MIIFRFSVLIAISIVPGCDKAEPEPAVRDETGDIYRATIESEGHDVPLRKLVKEFRGNPNAFDLKYEQSKFEVRGRVSEVFPFREEMSEIVGYHIPLDPFERGTSVDRFVSDETARIAGADVDGLSIFVRNFSKRQAAELRRGQMVAARCDSIRVIGENLAFDDCELQEGKDRK